MSNNDQPKLVQRRLATWGWLDETAAVALLEGFQCAWADLDGWHNGENTPQELPITTHLWAWNESARLRVRVDGKRALVVGSFNSQADLESTSSIVNGQTQVATGYTVEVAEAVETDLIIWEPNEGRFDPNTRRHFSQAWKAEIIEDRPGLAFYWQV